MIVHSVLDIADEMMIELLPRYKEIADMNDGFITVELARSEDYVFYRVYDFNTKKMITVEMLASSEKNELDKLQQAIKEVKHDVCV